MVFARTGEVKVLFVSVSVVVRTTPAEVSAVSSLMALFAPFIFANKSSKFR